MILHDPQDFGGLEEYATTLAIGLKRTGQQISVFSTTWVSNDNQYVRRLLENDVEYVQVPGWLSRPASHWPTKQRILRAILWLITPLILILTIGLILIRQTSWHKAWMSAHGWLRGQIHNHFISTNWYRPLTLLLLSWWRVFWKPDLLHLHGYTTSLLFVIDWAYHKKIPVVYEEHSTPDPRFEGWKTAGSSLNKASQVVAVSETSAKALREVCCVTRPIAVSGPLMPDPYENENGWPGNRLHVRDNRQIHVTTFARLSIEKGLVYLLEAIVRVRKVHPNVQFKIFGEGELRDNLLSTARELGLNADEVFAGTFSGRAELKRILSETDIFLLSSLLEGQPVVIVEAMAYGCPIVTTSVGGIPELIQDGVNGLLCPPRDPESLARKINTLIEDPALRVKLGEQARRSYVMGPFQPASVSEHFIHIYQEALHCDH